ncbi:hypothetical protein F2Q68_00017749 [Brassica cretica]|uniref:Uncharacterized protein n=1 Tax=Brassica cretica TaxID=69181 RepID=A0A8S9HK37_BRACR|nr:hypothetical protein F2Q68_00017749 [Brassica cretica]
MTFQFCPAQQRRTVCKNCEVEDAAMGMIFLAASHVKVLLWKNLNFGGVPCESAMVDEFLDFYSLFYGGG